VLAFILVILIFMVFVFLGVPVVYCFILAGAIYIKFFVTVPVQMNVLASRGISIVANSYTILAVPLFILCAQLMNKSGMTKRLVGAAVAIVGHIPGGLGHAVVLANVGMAGMSGSATADAAGIGKAMIPALRASGFSAPRAAALSAAAATMGPIIPPSIALAIYSSLSDASLGRLLLGGVVPGLLMAVFLMGQLFLSPSGRAIKREPFNLRRALRACRDGVLSLIMPLVILGGMFSGYYTPTEGAAVAVIYAIVVGGLFYRTLTPKDLWKALLETSVLSGAIMLVVMGANALSWMLIADGIGKTLSPVFLFLGHRPAFVMLSVTLIVVILGTCVEEVTMLILLTPILVPLVLPLGVDPIQFGIVFVLGTMLGLIMPPIGISMIVTCRIARITTGQFARAIVGPYVTLLVVVVLMCFIPDIVLWLPNHLLPNA